MPGAMQGERQALAIAFLVLVAGPAPWWVAGAGVVDVGLPPGGGESRFTVRLAAGSIVSSVNLRLEPLPVGSPLAIQGDLEESTRTGVTWNGTSARLAVRDSWWDAAWRFRVDIKVDSTTRPREDIVLELPLDLAAVLQPLGVEVPADATTLRVVETSGAGWVPYDRTAAGAMVYVVPSNFTSAGGPSTGTLRFTMPGVTPPGVNRTFSAYLDTVDRPKTVAGVALDLRDDVVFANRWSPTGMSPVFVSGPAGPDRVADMLLSTEAAVDVDAVDLDRDGYLDLLFAVYRTASGGYVTQSKVFLGGPDGYATTADLTLPTVGAFGIEAAQIDGDGYLDVGVASAFNGVTRELDSAIFLGNASGLDPTADHLFRTHDALDVAFADLNRDGWQDSIFANW